jgi:hypothetical protein
MHQNEKAKKETDKSKAKQNDLEKNFVFSWASSALASAAAATVRSAHKRDGASDSGNSKDVIKKGSTAAPVTKEGIYTTSQHPLTLRLMQLLCGAASLLYPTITHSARTSIQEDLAAADADQQVTSSSIRGQPVLHCCFLFSSFLVVLMKQLHIIRVVVVAQFDSFPLIE